MPSPFSCPSFRGLDGSADFPAWTSETMTLKRQKISIAVYPPPDIGRTRSSDLTIADAAVVRLARLIGRQIAREQFEQNFSKQRKMKAKG